MRATQVLLVVVASFALAGCQGGESVTTTPSVPPGAMAYTGYDASGYETVSGWIWLDLPAGADPADTTFGGRWALHVSRNADGHDAVLPPVDSWTLEGEIRADGTWVSLTPGFADAAYVLQGTLTFGGPAPMTYSGTWTYTGLAGLLASGTFRASQ